MTFSIFELISSATCFLTGYFICFNNIKNKIKPTHSSNPPPLPKISKDPMIFEFNLVETGDYVLNVIGMEGRHLIKENHKKFMELLKFIYENEKLRPFNKSNHFKLLTFKKKE